MNVDDLLTPISDLRQLANIINSSVDAIDRLAAEEGVAHPTIDTLYNPNSAGEKFVLHPEVLDAALLAISAASQLIATLKLPGSALYERASAFFLASALRITSEACVVEILRDAGQSGVHVKDIASQTGTSASLIGRSLRFLATHYVFREISPNVFVNNRISSMLDTKKDSKYLISLLKDSIENPTGCHGISKIQPQKYSNTNGVAAFIDTNTDLHFKSAAFLPDVFMKKKSRRAFQEALNFDGSLYQLLQDHPQYTQRFQQALGGWIEMHKEESYLKGFDWSSLPESALVVDVGGGIGSAAYAIAQEAPHVKIIVQDLERVILEDAKPYWESNSERKKLLESRRVLLEPHDFFHTQPLHITHHVSVFHLRFVTHDWPVSENLKMFSKLRAAANVSTRLVVVDQLVPYACPTNIDSSRVKGALHPLPPSPLLANLGEANCTIYRTDLTMETLTGAREWTLGDFQCMFEESGWEIEAIHQTKGTAITHIICRVVEPSTS